jgi:hypothetical protein
MPGYRRRRLLLLALRSRSRLLLSVLSHDRLLGLIAILLAL